MAWLAAFTLLIFAFSAFIHLLLVWSGPQPAKFQPPATGVSGESVEAMTSILKTFKGEKIVSARVVPSADGPLLQVSQRVDAPRSYYSLNTDSSNSFEALKDCDFSQAKWLGEYYSGLDLPVESIEFINIFSDEYPAVNRLLPVYRIVYTSDDGLVIFVHTESGAFVALNNQWKKNLQTIFQWLHTWSWLDSLPWLRVVILSFVFGKFDHCGARWCHSFVFKA